VSVFVAGLDAARAPVRDRVTTLDRPPRAIGLAVAVALNAGVVALVLAHRADPRPPEAPRALEIGLVAPVPLPAVPTPEPVRAAEPVPPQPKPTPRPPERVARPQPAPLVARPAPVTPPPVPVIAVPEATPAPRPEATTAPREVAPSPAPAPIAPPAPVAAAPTAPPSPPPAAAPAPTPVPVVAPRFDAAYLSNPAPAYPSIARRMGEQGRVILRVVVTADGRAERVEVRTSSGSERLDRAALEAVTRWRFVPARRGEEAVSASVLVPINFSLDG
jgi:protein TonB